MKSLLTAKNISITALIIVAVAAVGYYFSSKQRPQNDLLAEDQEIFLSTEVSLSYNNFLQDLEQHCPYYEPNGAQYRECLVNLLTQNEQAVEQYQADLIRDVHAVTDTEFQTARNTFITHLKELHGMWRTYRDTLCMAQTDKNWGGSNQGGFFNTCRLYETEKYQLLLKSFRDEWIR